MQHHPIITYLRLLGLSVGIILFVFMLFRSEQNAHDPVFVKGKPSLQWLATSTAGPSIEAASAAEPDMFATKAAATDPQTNSAVATDSASTDAPTNRESTQTATQPAPQTVQTTAAHVLSGKALGKTKHTD